MANDGLCSVPGCGKRAWAREWCGLHYQRWKRHGDPLGPPPRRTICIIEGCGKPVDSRDWCSAHYSRMLRHGDPLGGGRPRGEPEAFLQNNVLPYKGDDCVLWPYLRSDNGYAIIHRNRIHTRVSRIVCEAGHGPPPKGTKYDAAHSCGNGHLGCVTPRHLSWKTRTENMADTLIHGTRQRGETHASAKLTAAEVRQIRRLRGRRTLAELAKQYGVAPATISSIQRRQNWAWLD